MNLLTLRRREFAARVSDVGVMETEQAASRRRLDDSFRRCSTVSLTAMMVAV